MQPVKFIHVAGLRLDSPYAGLRRPNAPVDDRLRAAPFDALDNLVALCESEAPDFVLVAGGVFELPDRSVRGQLKFREALARISASGVSVYISFGPGDPAASWLPTIDWPDGVTVMGGRPEWHTIVKDGAPVALVQGSSHQSSALPGTAAGDFLPAPRNDLFCIGLASQVPAQSDDGRDPRTDLPAMHYWAIGPGSDDSIPGDPSRRVLSTGFTQGLSPVETGAHGCYVVETDDAGRAGPRFVALDSVRFQNVTVDVTGLEPGELLSPVHDAVMKALSNAEGRDLVARVVLSGANRDRLRDADEILDQLRESVMFERPWVWIDRVDDLAATEAPDDESGFEPSPLLAALNQRFDSIIEGGALDELIGNVEPGSATSDQDHVARDARNLATRLLSPVEDKR